MSPITATQSLARRIDHAELHLMRALARAAHAAGADVGVWPIGGAAAVLGEPGSPYNKLIGLGLGVPLDLDALSLIEREYDARNAPLQVELSTLADPPVGEALTARGYRLAGFENVLVRRLDGDDGPAVGAVAVSPVAEDESRAWIAAVATAFLHPDTFDGPAPHESFNRAALERAYEQFGAVPGAVRLLARLDGEVAGGASLYVHEGVALMAGAGTLPAFRRRGVQAALLAARFARARQLGCEWAVVTTAPGSKSQQNVQRAGFELVYSRAILVRQPDRRTE